MYEDFSVSDQYLSHGEASNVGEKFTMAVNTIPSEWEVEGFGVQPNWIH